MPHNEDMKDMYLSLDGSASQRWSTARIFQVGAALMGGACLGVLATSAFNPKLETTISGTPTSLSAMSTLRSPTIASLPGNKAWKELALAGMEASQGCHVGFAKPTPRFTAAMANMKNVVMPTFGTRGKTAVAAKKTSSSSAEDLPGAFPPLGFWDPAGFSTDISEGRLAYYREAELKHGRVCMLASLGIFTAERYHPLFGGAIDVPGWEALKATELTYFWPAVLALSAGVELVQGFSRFEMDGKEKVLKEGLVAGDIGYDPLGLKDTFSEEDDIEGKELAHARLAMISTLGIILQEIVFPDKFTLEVGSFS
jgi:hypothetical protein